MVLFLDGHEFGIFVSDNMKDWRQTQSLVIPEAWECPDLVRLRVQSTGEEKWLFWTPDGFYLVGEFDGMQFTATQPGRRFYGSEKVYAAQTVANLDGRVLQIPFARTYATVLQSSRPDGRSEKCSFKKTAVNMSYPNRCAGSCSSRRFRCGGGRFRRNRWNFAGKRTGRCCCS